MRGTWAERVDVVFSDTIELQILLLSATITYVDHDHLCRFCDKLERTF